MLLACDIGNTNIKTVIFDDDKLVEKKFFAGIESFTSYLYNTAPGHLAISSVVPESTKKIISASKDIPGLVPFIISMDTKFNLKILYNSPETLGIDRLCSAEGAFYLFKNSDDYKGYNTKTFILSIDFGTATTVNIVAFPGDFIGGIIAPGITMMFEALNQKTAKLPNVTEKYYDTFIGRDTNSSIASGVLNSAAGLIKSTINYLDSGMKADKLKIFITGGNAEKLLPYLDFEYSFIPELVLLGIKTVYDKNFTK
jgi:type III pantothenate kinase